MSIPGNVPYYVVAYRRPDGLINYVLMNPRGWGADEVVHVAPSAARDEEQASGRIQDFVPPWQEGIEFRWVDDPKKLPGAPGNAGKEG